MPFVVANGVKTFYRTVGEGPPLLLIAGNGMEHTTFDEQLPPFSCEFRCIVYDLRGIGASGVPDKGYDTRTFAADALALLDALEIKRAHVAGYSLGGAIGQELAAAHPDRVLSLSLYSSFDRPDPTLRLRYDLLVRITVASSPEIWALFSAYSAFGADYIDAHESEVRAEIEKRIARWRGDKAPSRVGLAGHYQAILDHDSTSRLSSISCPTWIAVGSSDAVMPPRYSERLQRQILGSKLDVFAGRPHRILNFEATDFTKAALDFLRSVARRT